MNGCRRKTGHATLGRSFFFPRGLERSSVRQLAHKDRRRTHALQRPRDEVTVEKPMMEVGVDSHLGSAEGCSEVEEGHPRRSASVSLPRPEVRVPSCFAKESSC